MTGVVNSDGDLWIDIEVHHQADLPGEFFGLTARSEPVPGAIGVYRAVQSFNLTAYIRHLIDDLARTQAQSMSHVVREMCDAEAFASEPSSIAIVNERGGCEPRTASKV